MLNKINYFKGRRSVCYDCEALESRKEHKPENSAIDMAAAMKCKTTQIWIVPHSNKSKKFLQSI